MTDYETLLGIAVILFCWVMMPIMYYLGYRDGRIAGFRNGLPYGALAYLLARVKRNEQDEDES